MRTSALTLCRVAGAAAAVLAAAGPSPAQIVILLNDSTIPFGLQCNEIWTDSDVELKFVPTSTQDFCPGACLFTPFADGVALFGRLIADLTDLPGIVESVEVDVEPFCAPGCTRAFLYEDIAVIDSTANATSPNYQTLTVLAGPNLVTEFAVSGCETVVHQIRIRLATPSGVDVVALPDLDAGAPAPNPFTARTSIPFHLDPGGPVRVAIYDVRGARIRSLLEGWVGAGMHTAVWDGRTDDGVHAPGGVYFTEVRAAGGTERRRIVRLR